MTPDLATLTITTTNNHLMGYAQDLANKLGLTLSEYPVQTKNSEFAYFLLFTGSSTTDYQLALVTNEKPYASTTVDFVTGKTGYRIRQANTIAQPLAKAVGLKQGKRPGIIDATAGMGRDAAVLANLGCHIHLIERSPIMSALLDDGLRRLALVDRAQDSIHTKMHLHNGDAKQLIPNMAPMEVIYLDPMYPKRDKQALVKKEMRFARDIVGADPDTTELLAIALNHAQQRVVVKRPRLAPNINLYSPTHSILSKNTRYDVYLIR